MKFLTDLKAMHTTLSTTVSALLYFRLTVILIKETIWASMEGMYSGKSYLEMMQTKFSTCSRAPRKELTKLTITTSKIPSMERVS